MDKGKVFDIASSTSNSFGESSVDEKKNKRSFFKKQGLLRITSLSSGDADISAIDYERDLTPGSLDVWVDLPDTIKYDPALAPFKQLYEQHHGKLNACTAEEGDRTIFDKHVEQDGVIEQSELKNDATTKDSEDRLVDSSTPEVDKKNKTSKQRQITKALRVLKLFVLVGGWTLITVSLLMNREKTDTVLHTAVISGEIKEYPLHPTEGRVKALITLTGPFSEEVSNGTSDTIQIWLHRETIEGIEENSTLWSIQIQNEAVIDFSESVTESKTLRIEKRVTELDEISLRNGSEPKVTLRMYTGSNSTVPLTVSYQLNPLDEEDGILYATLLLLTLYILIIFEIVNRTLAALVSSMMGVAVLACSGVRPTLPELVGWLDVETLLLLFSMMLLVAILAETGLFDYLAVVAFEMTGGKTWPLINCLCLFTAIFSTFLDNVTTVLLMTPVTIRLCEVMQLNPVPVLMSMVVFSNVGGAATPVGDPPNVIIASHPSIIKEGINFTTFTLHMSLGIVLVAIQTYIQLRWMYRNVNELRHSIPGDIQEMRQEIAVWRRAAASLSSYSRDEVIVRKALQKQVDRLQAALQKRETGGPSKTDPKFCSTLAQMKQKYKIRDKPLLIKSSICVIFVVVVFFLHAFPQLQSLSLGWTALLGAMLLLVLAERNDLEPILARVEWSTLLFFAALFVLMETLSKLGLIMWIGRITESLILRVDEESRLTVAIMLVLWVSGLASAFVDNIPLTTMMVRVTAALADERGLGLPLPPLAWALSYGACLGGNGTLIGASANVVCAGVAEQHGYRFTFLQFLKVGFPIMIGNLVVSSVYLLICHCLFQWH